MIQVKGICDDSENPNDQSAQTQAAASGRQLTFNDDVFRRPLFVEGGEAGVLADTHHVLSEVKLLRVEAQQSEPQLPHRLSVLPHLWPTARLNTDSSLGEGDAWIRRCVNAFYISNCKMLTSAFKSSKKYTFQPSTSTSGFFCPS